MKRKYEIRMRRAGDVDIFTLASEARAVQKRGLRGFFRGPITPPVYIWDSSTDSVRRRAGFVAPSGRRDVKIEDLVLDRDEARFILKELMSASHKERTAWVSSWDLLKMFACILKTDTRVYEENEQRYVKLQHTEWTHVELYDLDLGIQVWQGELDYFKSQGFRLQD